MKIRQDDLVVVISGNHKSPEPKKVISISHGGERVTVEGVNLVWKHVKKGHPKSPQGGRLHVEMPIQISNVMLYCQECGRPVRVGYTYDAEGAKHRSCKKCDATLGQISPPKQRYAKS